MRPFYADYVNHMLRYYSRSLPGSLSSCEVGGVPSVFKSEVDKLNWVTVDRVLRRLCESERETMVEVYWRGDTLADNVFEVAKVMKVEQESVWLLVSKVSKWIAKERKLI